MKKSKNTITPIVVIILIIAYYLITSSGNNRAASTPPSSQSPTVASGAVSSGPHTWGKQTKTSGCRASNGLQDSACTPGDVMETDTTKICQNGYAGEVRNVPDSLKNQVYAEYDITSHTAGQYEVDHLVSLELGGSNDISNLWPELADPKPGFHEKDKVENYLHDQVCSGKMSIQDAQVQIATNWLAVYNQMAK